MTEENYHWTGRNLSPGGALRRVMSARRYVANYLYKPASGGAELEAIVNAVRDLQIAESKLKAKIKNLGGGGWADS
jgi:hypothetical protein